MLRVVVSVGHFRPLRDFDYADSPRSGRYPSRSGGAELAKDEFKLYLWRNSTLRDIVRLVHASAHLAKHAITRDPAACSALALHDIRLVYHDSRKGCCVAREMGRDIARVSVAEYTSALLGLGTGGLNGAAASTSTTDAETLLLDEERKALDRLKATDRASDAARTLRKCQLRDGDILECMVFPDKTFVGAAAIATPTPPRAGGFGAGPSSFSRGPMMNGGRGGGGGGNSRMGFTSSRGGRWG
ncbi:hypothetical protein CF326_g6119 [Tilletia indica]|nr:hypothetical protein CF326_g6119 [Tilletia indica]